MTKVTGEIAAAQVDLPNFEELVTAWAGNETVITSAQAAINGLNAQIKTKNGESSRAQANNQAEIERWVANLADQPPIYSASYYLDPQNVHSPESIRPRHERGLLLHGLAESLASEPQPVLGLSIEMSEITESLREGGPTGCFVAVFHTVIGDSQPDEAIELGYNQVIDQLTGATTRSPSQLGLLLERVQQISSSVGSYYYPQGEETWLNPPKITDEESLELSLLATDKCWLRPHQLHTFRNGEPKFCQILSAHDIYVGKEAIRAQCESLSAKYQPGTFHDTHALQLILEACAKIT